jgi:hypothetical protein
MDISPFAYFAMVRGEGQALKTPTHANTKPNAETQRTQRVAEIFNPDPRNLRAMPPPYDRECAMTPLQSRPVN